MYVELVPKTWVDKQMNELIGLVFDNVVIKQTCQEIKAGLWRQAGSGWTQFNFTEHLKFS